MEPRPPSPTGVIPQSVSIAGFANRTIQQTALGCIHRYTHAELAPRGGYLRVVGVARGGVRVCREDKTFVPVVFGSLSPNTRVYSSVSTVALRGGVSTVARVSAVDVLRSALPSRALNMTTFRPRVRRRLHTRVSLGSGLGSRGGDLGLGRTLGLGRVVRSAGHRQH